MKRIPAYCFPAVFFLIYFCISPDSSAQSYVYAQLTGSPVNTTGWNLTGAATVTNVTGTGNTEVRLVPALTGQSGGIFYNQPINLSNCVKWIAEFDFRIYDGTNADGLAFCFLDVPPTGFVGGAGLGIPATANGLKVCFDTYPNCTGNWAEMPKIELRWGVGYNECWAQPTLMSTSVNLSFLRSNNYNHAKIIYNNGNISVYVNNVFYLSGFQQFNFSGYLGFTASTGALTDNHSIKNAVIYTDMPPSEAGSNQVICSGQSVQIGTNSVAGYVYNWTPTTGLNSTTISNPVATLTNNGGGDLIQKYYVYTAFANAPACPSMDSVTITVKKQPDVITTNATICQGNSYTLPWGQQVNTAGVYTNTIQGVQGCDSVTKIVNLAVQSATTTTTNAAICPGQSYTLPWGPVVSTAGVYKDTLHFAVTNCDSVIRVVNLTVQTSTTITTNANFCQGNSYALPWGTVVTSPGIYRDTLHYVITNCDSVIRIVNLAMQSAAVTTTTNPTICQGQSYTLPWGAVVSTAGTYKDTVRYTNGNCDSLIRIVNLTVQIATIVNSNAVICQGENYVLPSGISVNTAGVYGDTLRYSNTNCDSLIRVINLSVQSATTSTISPVICQGQSYGLPWGAVVNSTGIYKDTLHYVNTNCDSLYRIVNLTVSPMTILNTSASICEGNIYSLPWGTIVTTTGLYSDTIRNANGCDSLIRTVNLLVKPKPLVRISKSNDVNCQLGMAKLNATGGTKYFWSPAASLTNPNISNPVAAPTATTFYKVTVTAANGCIATDSIEVLVDVQGANEGMRLPTAFTPNGDGKNDCFGVRPWGAVKKLNLAVFNRWGQIIFQTTDPSRCWDGTLNGLQQPPGVYIYQVTAETNCGNVSRRGIITLIR